MPFHENSFVLVKDNARPHVFSSTLQFLRDKNITLLEWPACSPDCNPIDQLKMKIRSVWDEISLEEVQNMVRSFPSRLVEVVGAKGEKVDKY